LTDKGLLQLGVQDAAERQALLTARKNFQQQEQQQAQQQQQGVLEDSTQHTMVLPTPGTPPGASAGQSVHAAACSNTADSLQDTDGNAEGSKKSVVRCVAGSCCLAEVAWRTVSLSVVGGANFSSPASNTRLHWPTLLHGKLLRCTPAAMSTCTFRVLQVRAKLAC
jgi:hypothetical protein